ncbi:protein BIC2 [Ricinus communis]|uniref:protein BIC2 n=1 Tax=Ricinus communis TaxID=3988 RepID=UPI00077278E1|nr:protein BIC2 [Ricinus communis]|eukprot:XP_015577630.1 protein BIC2 [Ricinus communis]
MDSSTLFSPKKQESTSSTSKPSSRRILSPAKTNSGTSRVIEKLSSELLQTQESLLGTSFPSYSPRQHVNDGNSNSNNKEDKEGAWTHNKDNGRERLKRHREEVAGEVRIPDKWSQESLLRDWMDYSSFDKLLAPKGLSLAREALIAEAHRGGSSSSQRLRIGSRCF